MVTAAESRIPNCNQCEAEFNLQRKELVGKPVPFESIVETGLTAAIATTRITYAGGALSENTIKTARPLLRGKGPKDRQKAIDEIISDKASGINASLLQGSTMRYVEKQEDPGKTDCEEPKGGIALCNVGIGPSAFNSASRSAFSANSRGHGTAIQRPLYAFVVSGEPGNSLAEKIGVAPERNLNGCPNLCSSGRPGGRRWRRSRAAGRARRRAPG